MDGAIRVAKSHEIYETKIFNPMVTEIPFKFFR